ncbi:MAG: hypothetical protein ACTS4U_01470 [Candidatus Hodgkinia cicadicola]
MENRSYIRNSEEVNAHASAPPIPALISRQTAEAVPEALLEREMAFAERLHGLRGIIYLARGCKLHSATASNAIRVKSVPPKAVCIAQKMEPEDDKIVLNHLPHTADETLSKGQITIIAAGSALERTAERAFDANCGQVPRERAQELGVRIDESFAKTSLKGPYGVFERRRRISVTQTTLCLRAADSSWELSLRSSEKMRPPRLSTADISGTAPSTKVHIRNMFRPLATENARAKNLVDVANLTDVEGDI